MDASPRNDAARRPVAVLGEFDGLHVGHTALLRAASAIAERERRPLVAVVLDDIGRTERLSAVEQTCRGILRAAACSSRVLAVDTWAPDAGQRIAALLAHEVEPAIVVMACLPESGDAARYPLLRPLLAARRIELVEVERAVGPEGTAVSSAAVRTELRRGEVAAATHLLGAPYTLSGEVVHGSGLGHTIGYPTANLDPPPGRLLPALGVYAARVRLPDRTEHRSAVNVGVRPTVERDGAVLIEAHLLDFDADIYGDRIDVAFHERLRGEMRFESVDALIDRLHGDVDHARRALG